MKEVLSYINGVLYERAIVKGMKSAHNHYDFSKWEVRCWVTITEEGVETEFKVYPETFCDYKKYLFKTNSFKKLRKWLEEHKSEIV